MSELGARRPLLFADHASGIARSEARLGQQSFQLAAQQRPRRLFIEKDRKLQARGTGIKNEERVGHEFRPQLL